MSNLLIVLVGEAVLNVILILGIHRFFPRRSRSRQDEVSAESLEVDPDGAVTEAPQKWPALAEKIAASWLVVVKGAGRGAHYVVGERTTVIGRGSSCDIVLTESAISRKHARIVRQGDQFFIHDLDSTNGTFVDGEMVDPSQGTLLKYGSVISIGETSLVLEEPRREHTSKTNTSNR
jgi:hypothetical protein